jgi:hypothetical protein
LEQRNAALEQRVKALEDKGVLEYLHDAVLAYRTGQPCPKLLAQS